MSETFSIILTKICKVIVYIGIRYFATLFSLYKNVRFILQKTCFQTGSDFPPKKIIKKNIEQSQNERVLEKNFKKMN